MLWETPDSGHLPLLISNNVFEIFTVYTRTKNNAGAAHISSESDTCMLVDKMPTHYLLTRALIDCTVHVHCTVLYSSANRPESEMRAYWLLGGRLDERAHIWSLLLGYRVSPVVCPTHDLRSKWAFGDSKALANTPRLSRRYMCCIDVLWTMEVLFLLFCARLFRYSPFVQNRVPFGNITASSSKCI